MIRLRIISAFVFLTSLIACKEIPVVTFNEPQPTGIENLTKLPKRLQGQYINLADNSTLIIDDKQIQRIFDYDYKVHPNELDSNMRLSGDTIIDLETNEKNLIRFDGDSLVSHIHYVDTLFHLNSDNVVRKFKGYYFINTRYETENWGVKKIELSKGQLVISSISTKQEIDNLKQLTESRQDTIPYKFELTRKQFKKFLRSDGFGDSETFMRKKKNAR